MQAGEQVRPGSVVLVVAIGGRNQRAGVAIDHSGMLETLGEQIVVVAAEDGTAAGERAEPGRRPLPRRHRPALTTSPGEHGLNTVVRQLLDQPPQLPLGAHTASVARDVLDLVADDRQCLQSSSTAGNHSHAAHQRDRPCCRSWRKH